MKNKIILIIILLSTFRVSAQFYGNPTTIQWHRETQNSITATFKNDDSDELNSIWEGNRGNLYTLSSQSLHVDSSDIYAGYVKYENGIRRNVQWTDVYDSERLNPYLLADSTGRNYYHESYLLGGSWAHTFSRRIMLGLSASYKGLTAYSKTDPRPENTVSEIILTPGLSYEFDKWTSGVYFRYQYYKQHVNVKNYRDGRKDYFYRLCGFGLYDYFFLAQEENISRYYRSSVYAVGIQMRENKAKGFEFSLEADLENMEVEEDDYRYPYALKNQSFAINILRNADANIIGGLKLSLDGVYKRRFGRETVYMEQESSVQAGVSEWVKISASGKYKNTFQYVSLEAQYYPTCTKWNVGAKMNVTDDKECYNNPNLNLHVQNLYGAVNLSWNHDFNMRSKLLVYVAGSYRYNIKASADILETNAARQMFALEYDYRRMDIKEGNINVAYVFPVLQKEMKIACNNSYAFAKEGRKIRKTEINISLFF